MDGDCHKPNFHHYNGSVLCIFLYCSSFCSFETLEGMLSQSNTYLFFFSIKKKKNIHTISWNKKPRVTRQPGEAVTPVADGQKESFLFSGPGHKAREQASHSAGRQRPSLPSCLG